MYPRTYPIRGLQLFSMAKLAWYANNSALQLTGVRLLGHSLEAHEAYLQARAVLAVTHGSDHVLVQELDEMIHEARAELAQKQR